jgi:SAM-dependent methyltransferase
VIGIVERDDGFVETGPADVYFAPFRRWPRHQRQAMRLVRGRVLDVGCGAGRAAVHLQERGHEVVAIDVSPGAIEVCRERGVRDARVLALGDIRVGSGLGSFETILMLGNNFGLFGSPRGTRTILRRLAKMTTSRARIITEALDPYVTGQPEHLAYLERNRRRARMPGQVRMRVRYRGQATPWFDYLFVARGEMQDLIDGTGWRIERFLPEDGPLYIAILEKSKQG